MSFRGLLATTIVSSAFAIFLLNGHALAQGVTLNGTATQGTGMIGATVSAYAVNSTDGSNGATLGSTTTGSDGTFAVLLTAAPASPVRLTASGGSFVSPANGATIATPSDISLLLVDVTASVSGISINPLTDFVNSQTVGRLTHTSTDLTGALTTATSTIERFYSLQSDPAGLIPDYSANGLGTAAGNLALVLGGLAVEDQYLCPVAPGGLVAALSADVGDNAFDGTNFRTPIAYCGGDLAAISGTSAFQDALSGVNQLQFVTDAFSLGGPGNLLSGIPGYQPGAMFRAVTGIDSQMVLAAPPSLNQFGAIAHMQVGRYGATATLLKNGEVLITGGTPYGNLALNSTELYDPITKTFSDSPPLMNVDRFGSTATLLPNGKVLIAGGINAIGVFPAQVLASTELYDPATNSFAFGPSMIEAREEAAATLLPNGEVLILGGLGSTDDWLNTTELYDPVTNTFSSSTPVMHFARGWPTTTLLSNGKVLITGGQYVNNEIAEIYDPTTNTIVVGPPMDHLRTVATTTLLPNGKVLIAGGGYIGLYATAELYDPVNNRFTDSAGMMNAARFQAAAALLPNGKVLIAGGYGDNGVLASTELYDPVTDSFASSTPSLSEAREFETVTPLLNGNTLIAGGCCQLTSPYNSLGSAELYRP